MGAEEPVEIASKGCFQQEVDELVVLGITEGASFSADLGQTSSFHFPRSRIVL